MLVLEAGEPFTFSVYVDDTETSPENLTMTASSSIAVNVNPNGDNPRHRQIDGIMNASVGDELVFTLSVTDPISGMTATHEIAITVGEYATSTLKGQLVMTEVWAHGVAANDNLDESVEIRNVGEERMSLQGLRVVDFAPGIDSDESPTNIDYYIPANDIDNKLSFLEAGEVALITMGNPADYPNAATQWVSQATLNYAANPAGSSPDDKPLDDIGDGVWLFDNLGDVLHFVAYKDAPTAPELGAKPRPEQGVWDQLNESDLGATAEETSMSLATDGPGAFLSDCWEQTATGDATLACPLPIEATIDDHPDVGAPASVDTSLGVANVSSPMTAGHFFIDDELLIGDAVASPDGSHELRLLADGNLVLRDSVSLSVVWSTSSAGSGADRFTLRPDGELELSAAGETVWSSSTFDRRGNRLLILDDGRAMLFAGAAPLWDTQGTDY